MSFQAAVGTWFSAHLVADMPVGNRFDVFTDARPIALQFETGDGLDDIAVRLTGNARLEVQCKNRVSLRTDPTSDLGKTIAQVVRFYRALRQDGETPDPVRVAAVLAVSDSTPRSVDALETGCRAFDLGGSWKAVLPTLNTAQSGALAIFANHVRREWRKDAGTEISDADLVGIARIFRIRRFDMEIGQRDWREATSLVGERLFGQADQGDESLRILVETVHRLIRSGAPADQAGLKRALRAAGLVDSRAPGFDGDIAALRHYSDTERARLSRHTRLPIGAGVPIVRECIPALKQAVEAGSLFVIGEPGAGKTGALVSLADEIASTESPVIFLSVERLAGIRSLVDLKAEFGNLQHEFLDVLDAWPGVTPGFLIFDALDASRGGSSEGVLASLLEAAIQRLASRWSIVASIRTFDLVNGRRFHQVMGGIPPEVAYSDARLAQVRHFLIPKLTESELIQLNPASEALRVLITGAPAAFRSLLSNVFNLSLAAELVGSGVPAESIRTVATQSQLIDAYEDVRLPRQDHKRAIAAVVAAMVQRRRLTVRQVDIPDDRVDDLLQSGVLARAGDLVAFSHHVLFDHATGRFYLDWSQPTELLGQLTGDGGLGLLLGPALRFALERIWQQDDQNKSSSWSFVSGIAANSGHDPVVLSVALRTVAERVQSVADIAGLVDVLRDGARAGAAGETLSRLARFVTVNINETKCVPLASALAWCALSERAVCEGRPGFADGARVLLMALFERGDFGNPEFEGAFGAASRGLLSLAWSLGEQYSHTAINAIRFVAKSFGSDPAASKALLQQIIQEPRFSRHAPDEAPWLAEGIESIIRHDTEFAATIYAVIFGQETPQKGQSWLGGQRSQILPLSTTREQEYSQARWRLGRAMGPFLKMSPRHGTAAVITAGLGLASEKLSRRERDADKFDVHIGDRVIQVIDDYLSLQDWRELRQNDGESQSDIFGAFVRFLRSADEPTFGDAIDVASHMATGTSVWSRLLGIAAERPEIANDELWRLATEPNFTGIRGLSRDAVIFLASAYQRRDLHDRTAFENAALSPDVFTEAHRRDWWRALLARFLSTVPQEFIATAGMRTLHDDLEAEHRLAGNPPFLSVRSGYVSPDDITDRFLQGRGVDLEREPDRSIRAASRKLEEALKPDSQPDTVGELVGIWLLTNSLLEALDRVPEQDLSDDIRRSSFGAIGNAVERLAKSPHYEPTTPGMPSVEALMELIDRLSDSPYPEERESSANEGSMGWGNWDVRVYAASSVLQLARRFGDQFPRLLDECEGALTDTAPTVRLQIAQALNALWDIAPDRVWQLARLIAEREVHLGVLGFFVSGPLIRLAGADSPRVETLLSTILCRLPEIDRRDRKRRHGSIEEAAGNLMAWLYVKENNKSANDWIELWLGNLILGEPYLQTMLFTLRSAFFLGYVGSVDAEGTDIRERAHDVLVRVVRASVAAIDEMQKRLEAKDLPEEARQSFIDIYATADRLLDQSCNQIYFGSGAFQSPNQSGENAGLAGPESKIRFFTDYGPTLELIDQSASVRTIHHLIDLYAFLIEANPGAVFDRIAAILLGPAAKQQYQSESLASGALVVLVRRYLADYRSIFENADRRGKLISILELFSSVGWPDALKLLYELPDLLR